MQHRRLLLLTLFAGAVGCASSAAVPQQQRVDAHASLAAVQRMGPYLGSERIQTHLARAQDDLQEGDRLIADEDTYEVARFYYERSAAASDVALAWAHAARAEQVASNLEAQQQPEEESHEDVE